MRRKKKVKILRYIVEHQIVKLGLWFFTRLKPQTASNLGAAIAKFIGKKISVNQLAYHNISKALPELNQSQKEEVIDDMWDNLGRIVGEYGHIAKLGIDEVEKYCEMSEETKDNLRAMSQSKKGGIIFGAHTGNWEIGPKLLIKNGLDVSTVYRPLNNPYVEKLTAGLRGVKLIGKSIKGSRRIVEEIKRGGYVIILADQKISEGEPVTFFHDKAITTTSIARIALRYGVPLIPARSIRVGKEFKFIVETKKPVDFTQSADIDKDVMNLTLKINQQLEQWIRQYPSQWFWVHNRWKR